MRPTIGESLAIARRTLTTVIVPEVSSAYARTKAAEIDLCLSIASKRWADFYPLKLEERDDLQQVLREGVDLLGRSVGRRPSPPLAELRDELVERLAQPDPAEKYPSYEQLADQCDGYKAVLADIVVTLDRVDALGDGDEHTDALRRKVRSVIRTSLSYLPAPDTCTGKIPRTRSR